MWLPGILLNEYKLTDRAMQAASSVFASFSPFALIHLARQYI